MFNSFSMRTTVMTLVMAFAACTGCNVAAGGGIAAGRGSGSATAASDAPAALAVALLIQR